ncbi:MAG: calcium-binding protein [Roseobacter sp.]
MKNYTVSEDTLYEFNQITEDHFGVNLVTIYDEEFVDPDDSLSDNVTELGATTLRFPGGSATENYFDMTQPDLAVSARDPSQTLTPMDQFFAEAGRIGAEVSLVIPTQMAFESSAANAMLAGTYGQRSEVTQDYRDAVATYVQTAMAYAAASGVTIKSFEVGNEFWGSGEMAASEYGHVAGAVVQTLENLLDVAANDEAKIIVQTTSSASALFSSRNDTEAYLGEVNGELRAFSQADINAQFDGVVPEGWQLVSVPGQGSARAQLNQISNGINAVSGAADAIDGLVQHYYQSGGFDRIDGDRGFKFDQFDRMVSQLDRSDMAPDLEYHITEWNTKSNGSQNNRGLQNAAMVVEHFFELVINDVDAAQIWPLSFDAAQGTSLTDVDGDGLSITGQMFKMMSESLQGLTPILDWDVSGEIDVHGYGSDSRLVLFVSDRSGTDQADISMDISALLTGQPYFITSTELWDGGAGGTDATAEPVLTEMDGLTASDASVSFSLGSWANRRIELTYVGEGDDIIDGRGGDDIIDGFGGQDTISGDGGDDTIDAGAGDDVVFGGAGNDLLLASTGDDVLDGGAGLDTVQFTASIADTYLLFDGQSGTNGALTVTTATDGTDVLTTIEQLEFADGDLSVARINAYLDRTFPAQSDDSEGLGGPVQTVSLADIATAPDYSAVAQVQMEVGTARNAQPDRETWHKVSFAEAIEDAVVVMGPASAEGGQPFTVRVKNVDSFGFEYQLAEWAHLDGWHEAVSVSWMAGSAGTHLLGDGTKVSFGSAETTSLGVQSASLSGFDDTPVIFGQVTGDAESTPLTDRVVEVAEDSFDFVIQPEEALADVMTEIEQTTFSWSAFEFASNGWFTDRGAAQSDHIYGAIGTILDTDEALFADMQSFRSADTAVVRYERADDGAVSFRVQEEKSKDGERRHVEEEVAWWTPQEGIFDFV